MKHNLLISKISRWLDRNEYEAEIRGAINGFPISDHLN